MRTTINIDDNLLAMAKERARTEGRTLGELIDDALRAHAARGPNGPVPELSVFEGGTGPAPGFDYTSNREAYEMLDEEDGWTRSGRAAP